VLIAVYFDKFCILLLSDKASLQRISVRFLVNTLARRDLSKRVSFEYETIQICDYTDCINLFSNK